MKLVRCFILPAWLPTMFCLPKISLQPETLRRRRHMHACIHFQASWPVHSQLKLLCFDLTDQRCIKFWSAMPGSECEQVLENHGRCMTAYCIYHITYDPGISPGSTNECILGDVYMYLRSKLSRSLGRLVSIGLLNLSNWVHDESQTHKTIANSSHVSMPRTDT